LLSTGLVGGRRQTVICGFYISKILGFNELGRAEILYDDNDEVRVQKQDKELNNFLSSKSFEIKPTLPFSVLSIVKSANIAEIKKLISTYGINYKDGLGDTLLHIALKTNSLPAINFLLDQSDVDLNAKNVLGQTPLYISAMNGQLDNLKLLIALDACKAQCEAVIFWGHSRKRVRSLGDRVQDAVADERRARIREGLTALRMRRIN
jgi:ankyrin repeat protein